MVLNFRDVTERLHAQEELRANESLLRSITDSMLDMVAIVDKNAIFRYVSPSVEAVFGFAAEDVIGKAVYLYIHPDDIPLGQSNSSDVWKGGKRQDSSTGACELMEATSGWRLWNFHSR